MSDASNLPKSVLEAIATVVGHGEEPLHAPKFSGNEADYVKECIETTFVSSVGHFVNRFEVDLAKYTGSKFAIAVVNGTSALHIALKLSGVLRGDEVLVPTLSFVATANAVTYCDATPHFVDSNTDTLGIDPALLREHLKSTAEMRGSICVNKTTGRPIRAVVPMHVFGHPVDIDGLMRVADEFRLAVVEDAAEGLGSRYRGRHVGTFGKLGALSFNGNKIITTGGGGAILTDDEELAQRAKHVTTTSKVPHTWEYRHDEVGFNYRMPNLNAALGCAQLEKIDEFIQAKRVLHEKYRFAFEAVPLVRVVNEPDNCQSNYWLQAICFDEDASHMVNTTLDYTNRNGLMTRPIWVPLHELAPYRSCPRMELSVASSLHRRIINIPSSAKLGLG